MCIGETSEQFEELCDRFAKAYPTWIDELRKKRLHYLAFLKYPEYMRKSFSTTNLVEAVKDNSRSCVEIVAATFTPRIR